ncbi:hypothetical protein F0562_029699 [Nyssa sinensis]|uniref:Small ribosomal subunit protein uS7 domain-containing protein n=1 Tax=Nyssa sinensis TaxID=561372 RepID=A0A5J5B7U0_9ASTE|nr:hypothetical protein F0562_029699 [Nyssa sinensis]
MGGLDGEQKQLIKKLVNFRMKEGKRTRVRAIVYQTFHRPARTERDVIKLMVDALENIKPICEVEKVGIAGTIYDVPGIVARDRQQTLAIRWILEAAFKRRISYRISLEKCSFAEILDAYRKRGIAPWNVSGRNPDTKTCEIADAFPAFLDDIYASRPLPDEDLQPGIIKH